MKRINYRRYGFWKQAPLEKLSAEFDHCIINGDLHDLILPEIYLSKELFDKMLQCIEHSPNLRTFNYSKVHLKPEYLNRLLEVLEASPEIQTIEMEDCNFQEASFNSFISLIIGSMSLRKLNLSFGIPSFLPLSLQENFMSALLKSSSLEEVIVENRVILNNEVKSYLATNKKRHENFEGYVSSYKDTSDTEEYSFSDEDFLDEEVISSPSRSYKV